LDADSSVVRMPTGSAGSREFLLSDADPLWEELKNMHLEGVQHAVDLKVEEIKKQCEVRDASLSTSDLLRMLRESPGQRDAIDRINLHVFLLGQLFQRLQDERLTAGVGLLEQDIACGIDRAGKDVKAMNLQTQLTKLFSELETTLASESKLRMLMLYLTCMANVQESVRNKLIEMAKLAPADQAVLMAMLRTRLMEVPDCQRHKHGTGTVHRVTKDQAARFKRNSQAEGRFELSRFEPRVKALVEQLTEKRLSEEDFPTLQGADSEGAGQHGLRLVGTMGCAPPGAPATAPKDDWSFSGWAAGAAGGAGASSGQAAEVSQRVIVFILGGITLSELRAAAEVAQALPRGAEVLLGGTSVLTPRRLLRLLRPTGAGTAGEGKEGEDPLDLT